MTQSLVAPLAGMRYQAWLFWARAAQLLVPDSNVVEVGFEQPGVRSFDDIVVRHDPPLQASLTEQLAMEHVQAKYHIGPKGAFTVAAMTDPKFIGAESIPLLGLLGDAYRRLRSEEYAQRRFWIVSPWPLHPDDKQLGALWRDNRAALRLEVLRQGKSASSQWVRLRAQWRDAVGVSHDDDLYAILDRLRIQPGQGDLNGQFAEFTSAVLRSVGLKGIRAERADEPYSQLPWALYEQGVTRYTKAKVQDVATQYDLWGEQPVRPRPGRRLGIRTAVRWGDQMDSTTHAFLPLEDHFEGRFIREDATWPARYADVRSFLRSQLGKDGPYFLEVGAIATIAFAAGYALPAKDGLPVYPVQRRRDGADVWEASTPDASHGGWTTSRDEAVGTGADVALGLAVSQPVWDDMRGYVAAHLPAVGRLVEICPETGTGQRSIVGPGHALFLAEEASSFLRRTRQEPGAVAHLFIAAPNALTFMLGQEAERLGRCQLYEFDFGRERTGSYRPSLLVPDHTR